jgi:hypothetical protein
VGIISENIYPQVLNLSLQVEILVAIISGNRYSQTLSPLLTGRVIDRNNLRKQILSGS